MLKFVNVSLSRAKTEILKAVSFVVEPGEMVAILGESGAGKSSIFKLLIGALRPTLGHIQVDDFALESLTPASIQKYRRQIGVVFQDFKLLPQKTVFQNIAFALEVCGEEHFVSARVRPLLDLVGLSAKAEQFPHQLSGGEAQRVAIARALVHDPKILIADEATGNLDPKNSREIGNIFAKINREKDITVLFSTHDPVLIDTLFPRVIRVRAGRVLFDKTNYTKEECFDGIV